MRDRSQPFTVWAGWVGGTGLFVELEIGDIWGMSQRPGSPITPEELSALPPDFQALLRSVIEHYEAQVTASKSENARLKKTPGNSSLPPSNEHPLAKPAAK